MYEKKRRYSDRELSFIENTFKDQDGLLILFRRFLLQDELTPDELKYLKQYTDNPEVIKILRKTCALDLEKNAPLEGCVDLFSGTDLRPIPLDHAKLQIKWQLKAHKYLSQRFAVLEGEKLVEEIKFDDFLEGEDDEELYINFTVRNFLISYLDQKVLIQLLTLADLNVSPEEIKERLKKNSSK